jgi:hypothetical protein
VIRNFEIIGEAANKIQVRSVSKQSSSDPCRFSLALYRNFAKLTRAKRRPNGSTEPVH